MPNRQQRRANDPTIDKWLHVEDDYETPFDIFLRDISGKDEFDFLQMTEGKMGGLCDIFLEQKVTLVGVAGLIWTVRRKHEKKLTIMDVLRTVSMATLESLELHDPTEEENPEEALPADDPTRVLAEARRAREAQVSDAIGPEGLPGFGGGSPSSGPGSAPSTD